MKSPIGAYGRIFRLGVSFRAKFAGMARVVPLDIYAPQEFAAFPASLHLARTLLVAVGILKNADT